MELRPIRNTGQVLGRFNPHTFEVVQVDTSDAALNNALGLQYNAVIANLCKGLQPLPDSYRPLGYGKRALGADFAFDDPIHNGTSFMLFGQSQLGSRVLLAYCGCTLYPASKKYPRPTVYIGLICGPGYAKRLHDEIVQWARQAGFESIHLDAIPDAVSSYLKWGYFPLEPIQKDSMVHMELILQPGPGPRTRTTTGQRYGPVPTEMQEKRKR